MVKVTTDLIQQPASGCARDVSMAIAVNEDGSPISGDYRNQYNACRSR